MNLVNLNEEDLKNLKEDLYNIKKFISEIIIKGKEKIQNELDLKDIGNLISNYNINSNKDYNQMIKNRKTN